MCNFVLAFFSTAWPLLLVRPCRIRTRCDPAPQGLQALGHRWSGCRRRYAGVALALGLHTLSMVGERDAEMAAAGIEACLRPGRPGISSTPERPRPDVGPPNWSGRSGGLCGRELRARARDAVGPKRIGTPPTCTVTMPIALMPMPLQIVIAAVAIAWIGPRSGSKKRSHAMDDGGPPMGPSPTNGSTGASGVSGDLARAGIINELGKSFNTGGQGSRT